MKINKIENSEQAEVELLEETFPRRAFAHSSYLISDIVVAEFALVLVSWLISDI